MTKFLSLTVGCWLLLGGPVSAKDTLSQAIHQLIEKVDSRYSTIQDLQADFTQETKIEGFETVLQSSGTVLIKKPGLLRWDYIEPSVEQIYVKGDEMEMYVPDHNQVLKGSLTRMVATKAPLRLLQGAGKLAEQFEVRQTGDGELGEGGLPLLTLIPRPSNQDRVSSVVRIVSEIQPETYFIKRVSLHEVSGNISTFHFTNLRANKGLTDSLFRLTLPEGVVVVEDVFPQ